MSLQMHKITTKLGDVFVGLNNNKSLYFHTDPSRDTVNNFIVNGVDYRANGHMEKTLYGWKMLEHFSCVKVHSAKYNDYSDAAKKKARETIFNAIMEWLLKSETAVLMHDAQAEYVQECKARLLEKKAEKQKEIATINEEIATIELELSSM